MMHMPQGHSLVESPIDVVTCVQIWPVFAPPLHFSSPVFWKTHALLGLPQLPIQPSFVAFNLHGGVANWLWGLARLK